MWASTYPHLMGKTPQEAAPGRVLPDEGVGHSMSYPGSQSKPPFAQVALLTSFGPAEVGAIFCRSAGGCESEKLGAESTPFLRWRGVFRFVHAVT